MSKIKETEKYLEKVIKELGYDINKVKLESSNMKSLGQFQLNIAMPLAKKYQKNPRDIASEIVNALDERFTNINIAGPGFINLSFTDKVLLEYANTFAYTITGLVFGCAFFLLFIIPFSLFLYNTCESFILAMCFYFYA